MTKKDVEKNKGVYFYFKGACKDWNSVSPVGEHVAMAGFCSLKISHLLIERKCLSSKKLTVMIGFILSKLEKSVK